MAFLTKEMIEEAIQIALPSLRVLCEKHNWGFKGVAIAVSCPSLEEPYVHVMDELGPKPWHDTDDTEIDFVATALRKLAIASRTGHTSDAIRRGKPWLLQEGDSIYQGAVAEDTGLAVATSGSFEQVDEAAAWIVFNCISVVCSMKFRRISAERTTI